ncbi:MAG: UDP-3-O-acyl-N-acetylglucosamine deacetylase [Armatimonadota bacterium]|nr:UDP-3-O-acyl-N-acetylglucosamine deacetylase [Armatimonadota bacterium]
MANPATEDQRTLRGEVRLSGVGLHSGEMCEIIVRPAYVNAGITFIRDSVIIPAIAGNVVGTSRGATIGLGGVRIMTIEHLMAALRGCGVDNAQVEVIGSEIPALDGSAKPFVEAFESIGTESQGKARRRYLLRKPVWAMKNGGYILASPSESFSITYIMRYDHPMIGSQTIDFVFEESLFQREIAPARTFVLYEEVASLLTQRLAQGGSISNTIVVWQDHFSCELGFPDELVRHKALDTVGDLALLGGWLCADVVAVKSGHALNVQLAKMISEMAVCDGWEDSVYA